MGIIQADPFITLDGVYQAPGGPDEDRESGFAFGGWQGVYFDDESGETIGAGIDRLDALLLGRRTYDIFAGYWPTHGDDDPIAVKFNAVPKSSIRWSWARASASSATAPSRPPSHW